MAASLAALLGDAGLPHLAERLSAWTLEECAVRLAESRPRLLDALKQAGVDKLTERQRVANAIGKALRQAGMPAAAAAGPSTATAAAPAAGQPRIWLVSDTHTDHADNMAWARGLDVHTPDVLVLAGDISHDLGVIEETLRAFLRCFSEVFYCPGNHEAWVSPGEGDSLAKLERVRQLCASLGVRTEPELVGAVWVVPLLSWYDLSLDISARLEPSGALLPLAADFHEFGWGDFARCRWPDELCEPHATFTGSYPSGVAARLVARNEPAVRRVNGALRHAAEAEARADPPAGGGAGGGAVGVLSFSHFLPCRAALPDWMDPAAQAFDPAWLSHSAKGKAVKFSKVAGTELLDAQLRSITAGAPCAAHVHAFGHSHRPKDFTRDGVRYVHHPVAYGEERRHKRVPPLPCLKLLWSERGPEPAAQILRYWEEVGGSVD